MTIIARIETPKQRMTAPLAIILCAQADGTYSTHELNTQTNGSMYGHYDMTLEKAWEDFKIRANKLMAYGVSTFDQNTLPKIHA